MRHHQRYIERACEQSLARSRARRQDPQHLVPRDLTIDDLLFVATTVVFVIVFLLLLRDFLA